MGPFARGYLLINARLLEVRKLLHLRIAAIVMGSAFLNAHMRCSAKPHHVPPFLPLLLAVVATALRPRWSCARPVHALLPKHVRVLCM